MVAPGLVRIRKKCRYWHKMGTPILFRSNVDGFAREAKLKLINKPSTDWMNGRGLKSEIL